MRSIPVLAAADAALWLLPWPHAPLLLCHLALTLIAAGIWLRGGDWAVAPAVLGILGPVGLLLGIAMARRRSAAVDDVPRAEAALADPSPRTMAARLLDGRVRHAAPDALGSLVAIMRHGDVSARRRALETVVRSFEPALSPLVALALGDRDQTIRALAAAAAARIAANFTATRATLEAKAAAGEAGAAMRLAAFLAEHARANVLLSDQQRSVLRQEALRRSDDPRTRAAALWSAGDYDALDALAEAGPVAQADDPLAGLRGWWHHRPA